MSDRCVLVTGASGFVGKVVCDRLRRDGWNVRATGNRNAARDFVSVPISSQTDWSGLLQGCDAIVHLAARAHVLQERSADPLAAFREVNTAGALRLAQAAAEAGVRRFLFMSSIAVHGATGSDTLRESDLLKPVTPYGISKHEAELGLHQIASATGLELTVLRPPLVYGPGVGARFRQLLQWAGSGIPLPFGAIRNRRSLVGVDNLADAVSLALVHPVAAGRTYLVADDEVISTPDLIRELARGMGRPAPLWPVPPALLRLMATAAGRHEELDRLIGSLVVDPTLIARELSWTQPHAMRAGLLDAARWFASRRAA